MKTRLLLLSAMLLTLSGPAFGQFIEIPISVKIIVDPNSGARPKNGTDEIKDELFYTAARRANEWMDSHSRGYRFKIAEIVNIGGPSQGLSGPSKWYNVNPISAWAMFQSDTRKDGYLLRADRLNFYVTQDVVANAGGACPIAGNSNDAGYTACWALVNDGPFWLAHETGHFFGLNHTFGGQQCSNGATMAGDDGISDTLPEIDCWTQDQIAMNTYGTLYASLTAAQKKLVDDTFFNAMSYHNAIPDPNNPGYLLKDRVEDRRTEMQLDVATDTANRSGDDNDGRRAFVSGQTHFVSPGGSDSAGKGSSASPYRTILKSIKVAGAVGGDNIVLIRAGNYDEKLTISIPVTLRAGRDSVVTIGRKD